MERARKGLQRTMSILLIVAAAYGGVCTVWAGTCDPNEPNINCPDEGACCSGPDPYSCNLCADEDDECNEDGTCEDPL